MRGMHATLLMRVNFFFFSSRRRHTRCLSDWSSDVCSSDLAGAGVPSVDVITQDGGSRALAVDPTTRVFAGEFHDGRPTRLRLGGTGRTCELTEELGPAACTP